MKFTFRFALLPIPATILVLSQPACSPSTSIENGTVTQADLDVAFDTDASSKDIAVFTNDDGLSVLTVSGTKTESGDIESIDEITGATPDGVAFSVEFADEQFVGATVGEVSFSVELTDGESAEVTFEHNSTTAQSLPQTVTAVLQEQLESTLSGDDTIDRRTRDAIEDCHFEPDTCSHTRERDLRTLQHLSHVYYRFQLAHYAGCILSDALDGGECFLLLSVIDIVADAANSLIGQNPELDQEVRELHFTLNGIERQEPDAVDSTSDDEPPTTGSDVCGEEVGTWGLGGDGGFWRRDENLVGYEYVIRPGRTATFTVDDGLEFEWSLDGSNASLTTQDNSHGYATTALVTGSTAGKATLCVQGTDPNTNQLRYRYSTIVSVEPFDAVITAVTIDGGPFYVGQQGYYVVCVRYEGTLDYPKWLYTSRDGCNDTTCNSGFQARRSDDDEHVICATAARWKCPNEPAEGGQQDFLASIKDIVGDRTPGTPFSYICEPEP